MEIGDLIKVKDRDLWTWNMQSTGIITGFIFRNEIAEMVQIYWPSENLKDYIHPDAIEVIA
jgi:hypothetical protein|tara:strand:+ start:522 stop:704 length:183 start_codon:yes stop_codon:yes gene_type:complete